MTLANLGSPPAITFERSVDQRLPHCTLMLAAVVHLSERTMTKVFLCYRREDSGGHAGRIQDHLTHALGSDILFMDVDAVPLGANFGKVLHDEVAKCDVLLAVIGRNWLDARDEHGNRRLENPNDFVRVEIGAALQRNIPVVPILVDGAKIPDAGQLPKELQELSFRNGIDVRIASFHNDVSRLIQSLKRQLNIDIQRRHEVGSLAFFCAIGGGLLYIPFALLFFLVWNLAPVDRTSMVIFTILWMGCSAAAAVRSLQHGILLAGAGASIVVFFLSVWAGPLLGDRSLALITWASALNAVWFGASFYGTIWIYRKLRRAPTDLRWSRP
jgi:TIR domain